MELKDKVVVVEEIKSLCIHIKELIDTVKQLLSKDERLNSDLAIQKTICGNQEKKVKSLEIKILKNEHYFPASLTSLKKQLLKVSKILIST